MVQSEEVERFGQSVAEFSVQSKLFYDHLRKLKNEKIGGSLIERGEEYMKNERSRLERMKLVYSSFSSQMLGLCDQYLNQVNAIEEEDAGELERIKGDIEAMSRELKGKEETLKAERIGAEREPRILYKNGQASNCLTVDLISRYSGSRFYKEYMSDERTDKGDLLIDYDGENEQCIYKYMTDNDELLQDIEKMTMEKKKKLIHDLEWFELPIKGHYMNDLFFSEDNEIMEAWKHHKVVIVNGRRSSEFNQMLKDYSLLNTTVSSQRIRNITYNKASNEVLISIKLAHVSIIEEFLKNDKRLVKRETLKKCKERGKSEEFVNELKILGVQLTEGDLQRIKNYFEQPFFLPDSMIVDSDEYDRYLQEWLEYKYEYRWKLVYRSSKHGYTAKSFHSYCDTIQGPTLVVIKSTEGWIFGGYTTQSWECRHPNKTHGYEYKPDEDAFIFTLKNPYNIPPTQFMKRKACPYSILCSANSGPIFYGDITIGNYNNNQNSCSIGHDGTKGYECDPTLKKSLFVNTNDADEDNLFSVEDYEVYCIENYKDYVYNTYQNPDIIWTYVDTETIPTEMLKDIHDDVELLEDLEKVHCDDDELRLTISKSCLCLPSKVLPDTTLVELKYDPFLQEWIGDYKLKLAYRASEHNYSSSEFHECCDLIQGPSLVIVKSTGGWIFGGYTTQSWECNYPTDHGIEFKDDNEAFIFTLKNPHGLPPTRFMKRKESSYSIQCHPEEGPIFGNHDIYIKNNCNTYYSCSVNNDGTNGYECDSTYKCSLLVNTDDSETENHFAVLDYEVYCLESYKDYVYKVCKYPDIIWSYLKNSNVSKHLFKKLNDENELFEDLDRIHCTDNDIRVKVSRYFMKNPSTYLANTSLVDAQYDGFLKGWFGEEIKWKLMYRASENGYTAKSFHDNCEDIDEPTLIIIKSSEGYLFGGFTTRTWACDHSKKNDAEFKSDANAFIFTLKNPYNILPTRYMKKKSNPVAIICSSNSGPIFGDRDIVISKNCNVPHSCYIHNDGTRGYECDRIYKNALFVNSDHKDECNYFSVRDYEVYCIENYKDYALKACKYPGVMDNYIDTSTITKKLLKEISSDTEVLADFNRLNVEDKTIRLKISKFFMKNPSLYLPKSTIVGVKYDRYFGEWLGNGYEWKQLFRASEHNYSSSEFHECCDAIKGPTLVVIKSTGGWIFGGYTTQSWKCNNPDENGCEFKVDPNAFIFTLKNPHHVPPTRYMQKSENYFAIQCNPQMGPTFGADIVILSNCNTNDVCSITNDGTRGYECDPKRKMSLFVNTNVAEERNCFSVLDYEVYCIENYKDYIYNTCKYPDIIWNCMETNKISKSLLQQFNDDVEVLSDLDHIQCDNSVRLKISKYYFGTPSSVLPSTTIVGSQYDEILKEWLGEERQWKLIYRASEHHCNGEQFHESCDNQGSTVVVIKSSHGWIFGGYTTQSWNNAHKSSSDWVYKDDPEAFIFTLKNPHDIPPTRYMKRKESDCAIGCISDVGFSFGRDLLVTGKFCGTACGIGNDGQWGYDCDPTYKCSLFVNTNAPDEINLYSILDYEVFCVDF